MWSQRKDSGTGDRGSAGLISTSSTRHDYPPEKAGEVRDFLEKLVEEGKIRWYGWSTVDPEGARVFAQGPHCTAIHHWMNMCTDMPEMLAVYDQYDQASIVRSPMGSGNMTGKFNGDTVFPKDDMRSTWDLRSDVAIERRRHIQAVHQFFCWWTTNIGT